MRRRTKPSAVAHMLAELDHAKTAFFSNVSHEFRTPLTLMLGPIEKLLAENAGSAQTRSQLQLAHRNALRLLKLVNSLLDFSRIEEGRIHANYQATDLAIFTRDIASTFRSTMESAGLSFTVDCEELAEPIFIDRDMWEKIILNLLSNAFKFTLHGAVGVRLRRRSHRALLEIEDTGIGIPAEELPHLFERFHRVEKAQGRTHEGSGIGLALVRELVELHGASIDVESRPGHGSVFRIEVPFGCAHLPAEKIAQAQNASGELHHTRAFVEEALRWLPDDRIGGAPGASEIASEITAPEAVLPQLVLTELAAPGAGDRRFQKTFGARVFVVDDNADMRAYIRDLLSPNYRVETFVDGAEALVAAKLERPDLIVSDVMMPRLDGFGLLAQLRGSEYLRDLPVILLSARAGEDARLEGFDAGADDYLAKPFSARELLTRIGALLELTRMRAEDEMRLRIADQQKDKFLAMLAHELRNPLAPIGSASELLLHLVEPNSVAYQAIGMIKRQMQHLTRLVDDLLDISRITQGRIELQLETIDIAQVVAQAAETAAPLLQSKQQKLVVNATNNSPLRVEGDLTRLVQCVVNILTNAIKYTDDGGEIAINARAENNCAVIEVVDSGAGISRDLLPRVFDLFVQGERTLDRSQGGLGIGLSVVKGLMEMHGGRVDASSSGSGAGSTFTLRLPLTQKSSTPPLESPRIDSSAKKILIVDDNIDAADSLAKLLTLTGHMARSASSGREALQCLQSFDPDIAILDIGLPEMDGYELAAAIRTLPNMREIKLIALTGYGQAGDRAQALQAGFDQHLVKPIEFDVLRTTLEVI